MERRSTRSAEPARTARRLAALGKRSALWWVVALGVLLHLPALRVGLLADDHAHAMALDAPFDGLSAWNLYDFGSRERSAESWALGGLPWWTSADLAVRFWRPVPSLVRALDHRVARGAAWPGHVLGIVLFAGLLVLVHRLLVRLGLDARAATLAVAVFAVDESSTLPVGWLANRNSLLEAVFGVAALLVATGRAPASTFARGVVAASLAGLAALSKESGLVFLVLVPAFAWYAGDPANGSRRVARVALAVGTAIALGWILHYVSGGYGATSRFYPEPWDSPLSALARGLALIGIAVASLSSPFPADFVFLEPRLTVPVALVGAAIAAAFVVGARRTGLRMTRGAALLLVFAITTLAPQVAAPPGDRLFFVPAIAFAALAAWIVVAAFDAALDLRAPRIAALWLIAALPASALGLLARIDALAKLGAEARLVARTLEPSAEARHALVLQGPQGLALLTLPAAYPRESGRAALPIHLLQLGPRALRMTRVGERTLDVESLDEDFATAPMESVFLAPDDAFAPGHRWRAPIFDVTAIEWGERGPRRIALHFPDAPERLGIELFRASAEGTERLDWPAPGASRELPRASSRVPFAP